MRRPGAQDKINCAGFLRVLCTCFLHGPTRSTILDPCVWKALVNRPATSTVMKDICDPWKEVQRTLHSEGNLTLTLNTDGVKIFNSSSVQYGSLLKSYPSRRGNS